MMKFALLAVTGVMLVPTIMRAKLMTAGELVMDLRLLTSTAPQPPG